LDDNDDGNGPLSDSKGVVGGLGSLHFCQGSEGPWHTMVLVGGSRVAERMPICPSAYEASHGVSLIVYMEEGIMLTDALH
jgi:hypothetical protein